MKKGAMKAKKAKSGMKKRRAMKVSIIGKGKLAKAMVFRGSKVRTSGGLKKGDLIKNKNGKIVSRKMSQRAKKNGHISKWTAACVKARKALGIKGFCAVGGKTQKGKAL